jgi:IS1 family transposase
MNPPQNRIYDPAELVSGIEEFAEYLTDEYQVLYQVAIGNDYIRGNSKKEQITQDELESRLELFAFVKARYDDLVVSKINKNYFLND